MQCQYCNKTYSTMGNLVHHKKTAKYCLILQNKLEKKIESFDCSICQKPFTSKFNLSRHTTICTRKEKYTEKEIFELELRIKNEQIHELQEKLKQSEIKYKNVPQKVSHKTINKNIDTQNITNQTNHITIYQVMTPERVLEVFQKHYNLDTLLGGQKALARFVNEEFLKEQTTPIYVCGDRSRQKFYMVKDGKKEEDPDCEGIIGLSSPGLPHVRDVYEDALFTTHEDITEEQIQENYRTITNMDRDRTQFKAELSKIASSYDQPIENTPWQKAVEQLKSMREKMLPYETE
jgi:hypothetical protein